jgi:hypothetical protein
MIKECEELKFASRGGVTRVNTITIQPFDDSRTASSNAKRADLPPRAHASILQQRIRVGFSGAGRFHDISHFIG